MRKQALPLVIGKISLKKELRIVTLFFLFSKLNAFFSKANFDEIDLMCTEHACVVEISQLGKDARFLFCFHSAVLRNKVFSDCSTAVCLNSFSKPNSSIRYSGPRPCLTVPSLHTLLLTEGPD